MIERFEGRDFEAAQLLVETIHRMHQRGESPATSGNYSFRSLEDSEILYISESGVDKSNFKLDNLIRIDTEGEIQPADQKPGRKSSAETHLHLLIYRNTTARCVLHSHGLGSVHFAERFPAERVVRLTGLELLKGFESISSHEDEVEVPLYENTQDIEKLAAIIEQEVADLSRHYGFILRGHGLTTWGSSVADAKRHLEVFNYIFDYYNKRS